VSNSDKQRKTLEGTHHILLGFSRRPIRERRDDILEGSVEARRKIERIVEQTIGKFSAVCAYFVDAHCQSSLTSVEHQDDFGTKTPGSKVGR
jgi:hypothetical protein